MISTGTVLAFCAAAVIWSAISTMVRILVQWAVWRWLDFFVVHPRPDARRGR